LCEIPNTSENYHPSGGPSNTFLRLFRRRLPFPQPFGRCGPFWQPFRKPFSRFRPYLPEGANTSRLPALLPLPAGTEGPKNCVYVLLMFRFWLLENCHTMLARPPFKRSAMLSKPPQLLSRLPRRGRRQKSSNGCDRRQLLWNRRCRKKRCRSSLCKCPCLRRNASDV
jgi:hypothetical protein